MVKRRIPGVAALAAVLFALRAPAQAETAAGLPAEAPSSLFEAQLGGADAELFVKGSWEASLVAQAALASTSGSGLGFSSVQPLLFTQSPDLYLSFLLFKHVFVEARVADDFAEARYSFGYRGGERDALKEIRVGNDAISFPDLPFLSFGEGSYRSFGAQAKVETEGFEGRAMIRYDQATRATKRYTGGFELTETAIAAQDFVAGKWFYTEEHAAANLVIYVESASGGYTGSDSKKYRKLESGEYSYSATSGFISLTRAAETRVAASYTELLGVDVTIGGTGCALLYDPGQTGDSIDPYRQILCRYSSTADPDSSEAFVRDLASGLKDSAYEARIDAAGFVEVTQADHPAVPSDSTYAQPFYDDMDWLYTTDFSEDGPLDYAPAATKEIVVRSSSSVDSMTIDSDYVPGTVEVTRDGAPEYAFTVDPELCVVRLASSPGPYEVIEISYLRESSERRNGSLAAGLGGIWSLGQGASAWAAIGLRWAVPGLGYATADAENPGSITLTVGEADKQGAFLHRAALAASYSRDETSGRYRIEGMEESGDYATSFRPTPSSVVSGTFVAAETTDTLLAQRFPSLVAELHGDGSVQQALRMTDAVAWTDLTMATTVDLPPYESFTTFSFFVMTSVASGSVTVTLDEGTATKAVSVTVPLGGFSAGRWRRIVIKYGDTNIYAQDDEAGDLADIGDTSLFDPSTTSSRLAITVSGADADQKIWIDEIMLEDSVGQAALLFQGELSYTDRELRIGQGKLPLLSGLDVKADVSAGLHDESYASGGASLATNLGPLGLALRARGFASADGDASMSGGHELRFPTVSFPVLVSDVFDFDPETGAFGKEDRVSIAAGRIASLSLAQSSSWTPASSAVDGTLAQEWEGILSAIGGRVGLTANLVNRARPTVGPDLEGSGYGSAWFDTFSYLLPAFEAYSDRRKESATLSASLGPDAQILTLSASSTSEPEASGGGLRSNAASARVAVPLRLGGVSVAPYYKRVWSDEREGAGSGVVNDLELALSDFSGIGPLYASIPFYEFTDPELPDAFGAASSDTGAATLAPEAGIVLSREYGSSWLDLVVPSALSFAYRRELERSDDTTITDSGIWEATSKSAAINLFGAMGAYPAALPFDSDEYATSISGSVTSIAGESYPRLKLQVQHLASFFAGDFDRLDAENRVYVATTPSKSEWSETFSIDLSRREKRHWLLDLYGLALPAMARSARGKAAPAGASIDDASSSGASLGNAPGAGQSATPKLSIASRFLEDIASRRPNARSTLGLEAQVSRVVTDAEAYDPSWSFEEYYEAKLTVPERLTVSTKATLTQARDGEEETLSFGASLTLGLTISF